MEKKDIIELGVGGAALALAGTTFILELRTRKRLKKVEKHVNGLDVAGLNSMAAAFAPQQPEAPAQQAAQPNQ